MPTPTTTAAGWIVRESRACRGGDRVGGTHREVDARPDSAHVWRRYSPPHGARGEGSGGSGQAATGDDRDDRRARRRTGRGGGERQGVRGVPHRPALPGGRDQRRLPLPARARGRGRRRVGGRRRDERDARRHRGHRLARTVRHVPVLREGAAVVLLQLGERHAEDDPRRQGALAGSRHRCVRREDARRGDAVCSHRRQSPARGGRTDRMRRDGGIGRRDVHGQRPARRHRRRVRVRRRGRRGNPRRGAGGRPHDHRRRHRPSEARVGEGLRCHAHGQQPRRRRGGSRT